MDLIDQHYLPDGNKQFATQFLTLYLQLNDIPFLIIESDLIDLGLGIAKGEINYDQVVHQLNRFV
jgi:prophage maintenance system killer protein